MGIFTFFFHDRRYSVPTLDFRTARDRQAAIAVAREHLEHAPSCSSVEVFDDELPIANLSRPKPVGA